MSEFDLSDWTLRDLKAENISENELEELYKITKSYVALFSKRSTQIKLRDLKIGDLSEEDLKILILDHYSFLKRPVFINENEIFIGNSKNELEHLRTYIANL